MEIGRKGQQNAGFQSRSMGSSPNGAGTTVSSQNRGLFGMMYPNGQHMAQNGQMNGFSMGQVGEADPGTQTHMNPHEYYGMQEGQIPYNEMMAGAYVGSQREMMGRDSTTGNTNYEDPTDGKDVKEYFKDEFKDEVCGCNAYLDLARQAEEKNDKDLAYGLYLMGKDEYTHAEYIHDHLIDWGVEIPDEEEKKYKAAKERVERLFRGKKTKK